MRMSGLQYIQSVWPVRFYQHMKEHREKIGKKNEKMKKYCEYFKLHNAYGRRRHIQKCTFIECL